MFCLSIFCFFYIFAFLCFVVLYFVIDPLSVPQLLGTFLEKDSDYDRLHIVPIKGVECQTWRCDGCVRIQIQNSHLSIWNLIISQSI